MGQGRIRSLRGFLRPGDPVAGLGLPRLAGLGLNGTPNLVLSAEGRPFREGIYAIQIPNDVGAAR